ncbi:uncharacterized protein LOC124629696 [Helicoverpa zea]|uniref:uncharacterized protein LOC124629696 n=1 Tax=Helicoverpa zea TaxID=7113 RepID=UPI001F55B36B|nr:uncharacterized protein LOC124629696 [Helicoverpa zea]
MSLKDTDPRSYIKAILDQVTVTFASSSKCQCEAGLEEWAPLARADAQQPGRPRRAYERGHSPPRSDSSGYGTGGSCRSGRRSPQTSPAPEAALRRRSHDDAASPRHARHKRASANTSSLTEDLIRMMDAELGEGRSSASGTGGGGPASGAGGAAPLPLPDAAALDWAALVHTATRAMLQICEEHQYPSMDNTDPSLETLANETANDSWNDVSVVSETVPATLTTSVSTTSPTGANVANSTANTASAANCACGLASRVAALETDAAASQRHRHQLEEEVRRLRRHNARLREESARAVWQLRHFTQWLKRTVDRQ